MATASKLWTVEEVWELPDDGNRREVIDGELLVTPSPTWRHGDAAMALYDRIKPYVSGHNVGHVKVAPQDVVYGERTLVVPDLFVVPLVDRRKPRAWTEAGSILLAVEVLSPSTARWDRQVKRRLYQRHGVPEYWVVDVDARLVERWRPGDTRPEILSDSISWQPDPTHPALIIDLSSYFVEVTGEG
ncbi:MAG: Uma2 family endonuclease [Gemmatimonadaceae bacterium]